MKRMRLTIDMEALKVAYGEYIKGLEMSKAELMNLEPPFKYFDAPTVSTQQGERLCGQSWCFRIRHYRFPSSYFSSSEG